MVGTVMDSDEHYPVEGRISFPLSLERHVPSADILCPSLLTKGTGGPLGTGSVAAPAQCSLIKVGEMSRREGTLQGQQGRQLCLHKQIKPLFHLPW